MIFATVGTQLPFDRLLLALDAYAMARPGLQIFAQIGVTTAHLPHLQTKSFLEKDEMDAALGDATIVVGHAGMGTILEAAALAKPVIVMPRKASLGEHRNDHQTATVSRLSHLNCLHVVESGDALASVLDTVSSQRAGPAAISRQASAELVGALMYFIHGDQTQNVT